MTSKEELPLALSKWLDIRTREPSWILPRIDQPVAGGSDVSVLVFPSIDRRDLNGSARDPKFSRGYEIPCTLFNERLSVDTALRLNTALSLIRDLLGLSFVEGLAFVSHLFLFVLDFNRVDSGTTLFLGLPPQGELLTDSERFLLAVNQPRYTIEQLLRFWDVAGGKMARRYFYLFSSPTGAAGRPGFFSFPPVWLSDERLGVTSEKVPILVKPQLAQLTQAFADLHESYERTGMAPIIQIGGNSIRPEETDESNPIVPVVVLTQQEQADFQRLGFKSRLLIEITGLPASRRSNLLVVNGNVVVLDDADFVPFLYLVLALFEGKDGYVSRKQLQHGEGLDGESELMPAGFDAALHRIRRSFRSSLGSLSHTDFIQTSRGAVRLSTHPRYLFAQAGSLADHEDARIRELAIRLAAAMRRWREKQMTESG